MRSLQLKSLLLVCVGLIAISPSARANGLRKGAEETAEFLAKQFGAKGGDELATSIEKLALKNGDDVLKAVRKVGPAGIEVIERAGKNGPDAARILARHGPEALAVVGDAKQFRWAVRYGDDAVEAMIKHAGIAEPVIEAFERPAVLALNQLNPRNGRRLRMLLDEGDLRRMGHSPEMLDVLRRYGDGAMDFVWKHKGALAVGAVLAAFLADPQPFIEGTRDITAIAVDGVAKPLAVEAARRTNWTLIVLASLALVFLVWGLPLFLKRFAQSRSAIEDSRVSGRPEPPMRDGLPEAGLSAGASASLAPGDRSSEAGRGQSELDRSHQDGDGDVPHPAPED